MSIAGWSVVPVESTTTTGTPSGRATSAVSMTCDSMMMMTPSTACSCRREKADLTPSPVRDAMGSRVIVKSAAPAASAMASSVRMLPKDASVNMITPMVRNRPERRARAARFGR